MEKVEYLLKNYLKNPVGWMPRGPTDGWVDRGSKSCFKDCLHQSKIVYQLSEILQLSTRILRIFFSLWNENYFPLFAETQRFCIKYLTQNITSLMVAIWIKSEKNLEHYNPLMAMQQLRQCYQCCYSAFLYLPNTLFCQGRNFLREKICAWLR